MKMKKIKEWGKRLGRDIKEYSPAVAVAALYYLLVRLTGRGFCPLLHLTGFPCAGCGLTRAFLYLGRGQPARAFFINPMVYPITAFGLYCGYFRYIRGTAVKGFGLLFGLLLFSMLAVYAVRMRLYFPDRAPYVYNGDNVLAQRLPGYQEFARWLTGIIKP